MGWTGIFNWDSYEKNSEILNRQFFGSIEQKYEPLKWSDKGGHTWLLYRHKETGKTYATVILCSRDRKRHEFCYKEIGISSGPCHYDMPKSWLPLLTKDYEKEEIASEWLTKYKEQFNKPKEREFQIGDVIKCKNDNTFIAWGDGYKIGENEEFFVRIDSHRTRSRTTKIYTVVKKEDYGWRGLYRRLSQRTFKNLDNKVLFEGAVNA